MSSIPADVTIQRADRYWLPKIHGLLSEALPLDRFSAALLEEKLFHNVRPDVDEYVTWAAQADGRFVGAMQTIIRASENKAWLGVFAVASAYRRYGIGTRLYEHVRSAWTAAGVKEVEALAIPANYLMPGLDPRYTEALCFLEHHGFERFKDCVNMIADLSETFPTEGEETRLAKIGITVRRAREEDNALLDEFFARDFGADWRLEAELARKNDPPALHIAVKDDHMIAFSAHSGQNREWGFFGPMGTTPEARGTGIGRVLLWYCLNDIRAAGHKTSVIPWVGPIGFYSRYCPCRVDRVFWRYRATVSDTDS
jgi:mycothiol synthase